MGNAVDYSTKTSPVATDYLLGVDTPGGTWSVKNIPTANLLGARINHRTKYFVDPSESDHGAAGSGASLKDILDTLGTATPAEIIFTNNGTGANTDYTISTTYDASAYTLIILTFENGARLVDDASNASFTWCGGINAHPLQQIFDFTNGSGSVRGPILNEWAYPQWFGAVAGDGIDDSQAVSDAINLCDKIKIIGNTEIQSQVTIAKDNVVIDGAGGGVVDTVGFSTGSVFLFSYGYKNGTVRNLEIFGERTVDAMTACVQFSESATTSHSTDNHGLDQYGHLNGLVENCVLHDVFGSGVIVYNGDGCVVRDCYIYETKSGIQFLSEASNCKAVNNIIEYVYVDRTTFDASDLHIYGVYDGGYNSLIEGNTLRNISGAGVKVEDFNNGAGWSVVKNNIVYANRDGGIWMLGSSSGIIEGNLIYLNHTKDVVLDQATKDKWGIDATVGRDTIKAYVPWTNEQSGTAKDAITIWGDHDYDAPTGYTFTKSVIVANNVIEDNYNQVGIQVGWASGLASTYGSIVITGNTIKAWGAEGIAFDANALGEYPSNVTISGNTITSVNHRVMDVNAENQLSITGNTMDINYADGTRGVSIGAPHLTFSNNTLTLTDLNENGSDYPCMVTCGSDAMVITGNKFDLNNNGSQAGTNRDDTISCIRLAGTGATSSSLISGNVFVGTADNDFQNGILVYNGNTTNPHIINGNIFRDLEYAVYNYKNLNCATLENNIYQTVVNIVGYITDPISVSEQHTKTIELSAADVVALETTAVTLVPAPGAKCILEFVSAVISYNYTTTAFTVNADDDFVIQYSDGLDVTAGVESTGFIDQTNDEMRLIYPTWTATTNLINRINTSLEIYNPGTGITNGGSSTVFVHITYRIHSTGL